MEVALGEIALVIFTAIAPAGALGFIFMAVAASFSENPHDARRLRQHLVIPLSLVLLGLIASATHLGTPANALYVLTGVGRSPLSNEVVSAVVFLALSGVYWMVSFGHGENRAAQRVWLIACVAAGLVFVLFVSLAYTVRTIPTWSLPVATATLWANALVSGPLLALFGIMWTKVVVSKRVLLASTATSGVAIAANAGLLVLLAVQLRGISTTAVQASDLVPFLPLVVVLFAALALAGLALCFVAARAQRRGSRASRFVLAMRCCLGAALSLLACFIVRFSFYAMYMTIGV